MAIETRYSKSDGKPRYLVRVDVRTPDGRRKQQRIGSFTSKREAERAEAEAITNRERGTLLLPDTTTVAELLDEWLRSKAGEISSNTLNDYGISIRKHLKPVFGNVKIQQLTPARINSQYVHWREEGLSAHVVRGAHLRLCQALDYGVRLKLLLHNPARDVKPPRIARPKFDYWNVEEAARFISAAKADGLYPLWELLLREGMRRGEALGLRWKDLNFERGSAHIVQTVVADKANKGTAAIQARTKTGSGARSVRLSRETLAALQSHRQRWLYRRSDSSTTWQETDLILCTSRGGPINPDNVDRSFSAIVRAAGLRRIKVHELRHTSATLLLMAGIPAKVVSEKLGHASIAITLDTYSHVLPDMQDDAVAKMSEILERARQAYDNRESCPKT
jgi:integrase